MKLWCTVRLKNSVPHPFYIVYCHGPDNDTVWWNGMIEWLRFDLCFVLCRGLFLWKSSPSATCSRTVTTANSRNLPSGSTVSWPFTWKGKTKLLLVVVVVFINSRAQSAEMLKSLVSSFLLTIAKLCWVGIGPPCVYSCNSCVVGKVLFSSTETKKI